MESVELRETGRFVHVVTGPGSVLVLPAWMFDPVMCAGMHFGAPQVSTGTETGPQIGLQKGL